MSDRRRKRNRNDRADKFESESADKTQQDVDDNSPVIQMFKGFQQALDHRHDKYERIVKLSRDITIESKRAIFMLHRVTDPSESTEIFQQVDEKLAAVENTKFLDVAKEIENNDPFQFLRAYSPGLQEYIEALTFYFFLKTNRLIKLEDVQARLTFKVDNSDAPEEISPADDQKIDNSNKSEEVSTADNHCEESCEEGIKCSDVEFDSAERYISVYIPATEYILGVADLTGEMMRRAINSVGSGDLDRPFEIRNFLQEIEVAYSSLGNSNREVNRKLHVLRQSLRKVETACYTLKVRGSEVPKHMLVDMISKTNISQFSMDDSVMMDDD